MSRFSAPTRYFGKTATVEQPVELTGYIQAETPKAILLELSGIDPPKSLWFPLSQVKSITRAAPDSDDIDTLKVSQWIWGRKVEDEFNGKDPIKASATQVDIEQGGVENTDPFYDEEGPPW